MKTASLKNRTRRGQGMTEYIIIVALIAIAAIGVITTFGNDIRRIFDSSTDSLSGNTTVTNASVKAGFDNKGLKDFGNNTIDNK